MQDKLQESKTHSRSFPDLQISAWCLAIGLAAGLMFAATAGAQSFQVIHDFTGGQDGGNPAAGLTMDAAGNLYGTAWGGGTGYGTVFRLGRRGSGWIFTPLYSFAGGNDGATPGARVIFGPDDSLYGTTERGGGTRCFFGGTGGCGLVFNLRPSPTACQTTLCPWMETVLYRFNGGADGGDPDAEVIFDPAGALYSTTAFGGAYGHCNAEGDACGTAYQLTRSGDSWNETVLYNFGQGNDSSEPLGGVIRDHAGNLYGTAYQGGFNFGTVFELTPSGSSWTETILHRFNTGNEGENPYAGVIMDSLGVLYGATTSGGNGGGGTVFKLTQSGGIWTFANLYSFAGSSGGPAASLVMDAAGNLYGTTQHDGAHGYGSVFKLSRSGDSWTYTSLHDFTGGNDGGVPLSNVTFDSNGNLYGTTFYGGTGACNFNGGTGCGVVWQIVP